MTTTEPTTDPDDRGPTLLDYWIAIYRRRYSIAFIVVCAAATSFAISRLTPPVYEASAAFYVPMEPPEVNFLSPESMRNLSFGMMQPLSDEDLYKPYIGILKSRRLAEYVHSAHPEKSISKMLRSDMDFEVTDNFLIRVYGRDNDPQLAADITNAYVTNLNRILAESSHAQLDREPQSLGASIDTLAGRLREAESALEAFEEANNMALVEEQIRDFTSQNAAAEQALKDLAVSLASTGERIEELTAQLSRERDTIARHESVFSSPLVEGLRLRLAELSTATIEKTVELGEGHKEVRLLGAKREALEAQLSDALSDLIDSQVKPSNLFYEEMRKELVLLLVERSRLEGSQEAQRALKAGTDARMRELPRIRSEWKRRRDDVERLKQLYGRLVFSMQELELQKGRNLQMVVSVDTAGVPGRPAFPILWLNLFVAVVAGLVVGVLYAIFLDSLERTEGIRIRRIVRELASD